MDLLTDLKNPLWRKKNVIYCYTNKINGKKYVGQTLKTLRKRNSQHIIDSHNPNINGYNYPFHSAIRKYGIENFTLEILHIADEFSIDLLEIYYINTWDLYVSHGKGYNLSSGGGTGNNFYDKTEEEMDTIKRKISESNKGKHYGENNYMFGKKGSLCPSYGLKRTEEQKEQIRKNNPRRKCVKCLEYDIIEISYRKMSTTLYEKYGIICSHASISAVVNGKQSYCGKDKDGNPLQLHFIQIDDTYND